MILNGLFGRLWLKITLPLFTFTVATLVLLTCANFFGWLYMNDLKNHGTSSIPARLLFLMGRYVVSCHYVLILLILIGRLGQLLLTFSIFFWRWGGASRAVP